MFRKATLGLAAIGLLHGASAVAWHIAWQFGRTLEDEIVFMWVWYAWTAVQLAVSLGISAMIVRAMVRREGARHGWAGMPDFSHWDLPESSDANRPKTRMA